MSKKEQLLRLAPFILIVLLSFCIAYGVRSPRKGFHFDVDISGSAILDSLSKVQHFQATLLVFVLAWIAFGRRRLFICLLLTTIVGLMWEICEATALSHSARLSDLAPDLVAAFGSYLLALVVSRFLFRCTSPEGSM